MPAPIQYVWYQRPAEVFRHPGAEQTRPASCYGDMRPVFDPETDHFIVGALDGTNGTFDSFCLGAGPSGNPNAPWAWSRIYWNGHAGDGPHLAVTQSEVLLVAIGDLLRCDKASVIAGAASCVWQAISPGLTSAYTMKTKNGPASIGAYVGLRGTQLVVGYTDGTPETAVQLGDLAGYAGAFTFNSTDGTVPGSFQLRDVVYNQLYQVLWVAFQGKCQVSGAHTCMGAVEIASLAQHQPIAVGWYQFDEPGNWIDSALGGMTVDGAGYPMFTWVASASGLGPSMAVGGFVPDQPGVYTLNSYAHWRVIEAGARVSYARPDYTEIDTIPGAGTTGTNLVVPHGLHGVAPSGYLSDVEAFSHCANPHTGYNPRSCPN